ncbi:uncharacterized protein FIBRA_03588 [Fibroporia radiculosa]|uniref:Ketoreductase domain-containing protein n=1 Tax=Fibroporia radiculosa TaxID=599839 RepID=J4HW27_9APHY|nr:uncharacterized protein FIBRA_03588 [Fibroporia radiculosa]CCM01532.1 predicted protein [Fibroporia radiculosa]
MSINMNFPPHSGKCGSPWCVRALLMVLLLGVEFVKTARHDTYPAIDPTKTNLTGQVALITGASKGIGKATAVAFAQAGASGLVLLARSDLNATKAACEAAAKRPGQSLKVLAINVDVSNTTQVNDAMAKVKETFGRLDIVVNNAGAVSPLALLAESDSETWWHVWDVNIRGTYEVTRAALPLLVESEGNRTVIIVSSLAAHGVFKTHGSAYGTTKLAHLRLAEYIAHEYGDKGVVAYAIHPGGIITDMTSGAPESYKQLYIDTLEVAAHTMVWLAREPKTWLSGRYVSCQWDVEELEAKKQEIVDGDKLKIRMVI